MDDDYGDYGSGYDENYEDDKDLEVDKNYDEDTQNGTGRQMFCWVKQPIEPDQLAWWLESSKEVMSLECMNA